MSPLGIMNPLELAVGKKIVAVTLRELDNGETEVVIELEGGAQLCFQWERGGFDSTPTGGIAVTQQHWRAP